MAKRRKEKDEEEDKPFKLPKFDEEAFLIRERRNIKTTIISFLFGCFMALVCFGFWALMGDQSLRWELVLLVGVINAAFLKYIFVRLNIDLSDFQKKNWFSSYAIYFISWLIVFIILVNPPFYDDESPKIEVAVLPAMQEAGGDVLIVAKITDNLGITKDNIQLEVTDSDGNIIDSNFDYKDSILRYTNDGPEILDTDTVTYNFKIAVKDKSGKATETEGSFSYSNDTITLAKPDPGSNIGRADDVKFTVNTEVNRVFYRVNNGEEINATQQEDRPEFYVTNAEYKGWIRDANVTVNISAEVVYNFINHFYTDEDNKVKPYYFINYINDTTTYPFKVEDDSYIGTKDDEEIAKPEARIVGAPGFELILFLISLIVVVLIFKYRKNDRRKQK